LNGTNGLNGLNCWDIDGDGIQDASEDINNDGNWNALDCQGSGGTGTNGLSCWDLNGNGIQDASEDINNDGFWHALDCRGADGIAGAQGPINWRYRARWSAGAFRSYWSHQKT
jgi:hypothetical protein